MRASASAAVSVERFFQVSLLGLVSSGYLAVAGSGYLDIPTIVLTAAGLVLRGLLVFGVLRLDISERVSTLAALGYTGFFALDYFLLSRDFLSATVHLLFFLAVMKILTARTSRDYLYTAVIAFLELLAAAILSININFFVFLALYLLFAMAALTSGEIRRSVHKARTTARGGLKRFHPRLGLLSVLVTLGILVLTAGLFFLLPRTADAAFSRLVSHGIYLPGFSNQVTLGDFGEIKTSSRPVMHIRIYSPEQIGGLKWRGGALTNFDGKHWSNPSPMTERIPIDGGHVELRSADMRQLARGFNYDVVLDAIDTDTLFFAGIPQRLDLRYPNVLRTEVGTYRLEHKPAQSLRYGAYSLLEQPPEATRLPFPGSPLTPAERDRYLQRPTLDPRIAALARDMTVGAITDLERARAIERRLRSDYGYTLQLPDHEVTDPLAYFLFSRRKGHCEYFASAMAIMLRTLNIPTRMATGFQSGVYNPLTELWVIRASDAHTWVEGWIPRYGWVTFDPTPPDTSSHALAFMTRLSLYVDAAETFWQEWVVSYDPGHQGILLDNMEQNAHLLGLRWFESISGVGSHWSIQITAWLKEFGIRIVIGLMLVLWIWLMGPRVIGLLRIRRRVERVRRGQASVADATLLYERMLHVLKRHGYQKPAWFTPAEFAASLPPTAMGTAVTEFTLTYNAMRFGGHTEVASRLSVLLDSLERQGRQGRQ